VAKKSSTYDVTHKKPAPPKQKFVKKNFLVLGFRFFMHDITSGILLDLFGTLHLALGPNRWWLYFNEVFWEVATF